MSALSRARAAPHGRASRSAAARSVGIIGAGRVGAVLGAALARAPATGSSPPPASPPPAPHRIRTPAAATPQVAPADEVARPASTCCIIAVPDDALRRPRARPGRGRRVPARAGRGAHLRRARAGRARAGGRGGRPPLALHPAMTFTGHAARPRPARRGHLVRRHRAATTCARRHPARRRPRRQRSSGSPRTARPLYHAALAHGANHLVTLVNEAIDRLRDAGVRAPRAGARRRCCAPRWRTRCAHGDAALTGPVARGDAGTIAKHLAALRATAPDSVPAYLALARRTADRAIASGRLRPIDAEPLLGVLAADRRRRAEVSAHDRGVAWRQPSRRRC